MPGKMIGKARRNIYLTPELRDRVDKMAENVHLSFNQIASLALEEFTATKTQADLIAYIKGK